MSKKLSKYIVAFDYIDKILIVFPATSGGISISSFLLLFSLATGIIKKIVKNNKKEKEATQ